MPKSRSRRSRPNGSRVDRDVARMSGHGPGPNQQTPPVHRGGGVSSPKIDTGGSAGGPGPEAGQRVHPPHGQWRPGTRGMLVAGAAGLGVGGLMIRAHRRRNQVTKVYDPITDRVYEVEKRAHSGSTGKAPGQFAHRGRMLYGAPQGEGGHGRGSAHMLEAAPGNARHGGRAHSLTPSNFTPGRAAFHGLGTHPGTLARRVKPLTPAGSHVQSANDLSVTTRTSPRRGSHTALALYRSGDQNNDTGGGKFYGRQASHVRKSVGFQAEGMPDLGLRGTPFSAMGQVSRVGRKLPA